MKTLTFLLSMLMICTMTTAQNGWQLQNSGTNKFLTDIIFTDKNNGWASGWTGTILRTSDGGETWGPQSPPPNNAYESIFFADEQTGWSVGYAGYIVHTTDGGENWDLQSSGTSLHLQDVFFLSQDMGWVAGGRFEDFNLDPIRIILHTENGGDTWTTQYNVQNEVPLLSIFFINESTGYAVGEKGTIMKSTNSGGDWTILMTDNMYQFRDVFFVSPDIGWVCGNDLSLDRNAVIFSTTDGGNVWADQVIGSQVFLSGITFVNANEGWTVGGGTELSNVFHTADGGVSWISQPLPTTNALTSVTFTDNQNGWAAGYNGTIIHTSSGGTVGLNDYFFSGAGSNEHFGLVNYPDPVSSRTQIEYVLQETGQVNLILYNNYGQQLRVLVDRVQSKGRHRFELDVWNLSEGIYFYRIIAFGKSASGKLLISR